MILLFILDLYYLAFPDDKTSKKVLVYSIYLLETVQAILLLMSDIYSYGYLAGYMPVTTSNGDIIFTFRPPDGASVVFNSSWVGIPLLGGLGMVSQMKSQSSNLLPTKVTLAVQSFYAYRLLVFTRSWVIVILIVTVRSHRNGRKSLSTQLAVSRPIRYYYRRGRRTI
jgi:hypothetical protein